MAFTRAQLLMGDAAQDTVLAGQVQAVKEGDGVTILPDGTIEVDSQSIRGVMRLGQTAAYADSAFNGYWWPQTVTAADVRRQITITGIDVDGYAILAWDDPDGIPWTLKGQVVVGTGINTQILLDPGTSTSALIVDSTTASGLRWSDSSTGALLMPTGTSGQRPTPAIIGQTRFNTTNSVLEVFGASGWAAAGADWTSKGQLVVGTGVGTQTILNPGANTAILAVDSTTTSGLRYTDTSTSAIQLPAGNDASRPSPAVRGQTRFNTQTTEMEIYNGTTWAPPGFPAGTTMLFAMAAAPTGWTRITTAAYDNAALRLVTGTGGGTGGTIAFSTLFSPTSVYSGALTLTSGSVGNTTLTEAQLASHRHTYAANRGGSDYGQSNPANGSPSNGITDIAGGNQTHTHSLAGANATGTFTSDFNVKYVDLLACTKS